MPCSNLNTLALTSLIVGSIFASHAVAQEEAESIGEEVMEIQMAVDDESGSGPVIISSSRMSFSGDPEGGTSDFQIFAGDEIGGSWMPAASVDPLSLLNNKDVREELELVGDQLDKYQSAQEELKKQLKEKTQMLRSGSIDPSEIGELAKQIGEMQKAGQERMKSMLLPHQLDRLKQIALQMQMKKRGAANTLLSKQMAEELGIDEAQQKRIREREKELKKELETRMAELKEEIREKLLAELTSEQKAKLEEMSGDSFDYKPVSLQDRIRKRIQSRMSSPTGQRE